MLSRVQRVCTELSTSLVTPTASQNQRGLASQIADRDVKWQIY